MSSALRRRPMVVLGAVVALVIIVVGAGVLVFANPFAVAPVDAADQTVWGAITDQIRDGHVGSQTALEAFAYLYRVPVPGVTVPAGRTDIDVPQSGTEVTRWLQANWDKLLPQQQAAIQPFLQPGPSDTTLTINLASASTGSAALTRRPIYEQAPINRPPQAAVRDAPSQQFQDAVKAELLADVADIGQRLGMTQISEGLGPWQNISLTFSDESGGNTLLRTYAQVNRAGIYSPCNVFIYSNVWNGASAPGGKVSDSLHVLLTHEVVHCYQNTVWGSVDVALAMPSFITEGTALWLAADETKIPETMVASQWRDGYFYAPERALTNRTYDAFGYYALLAHLGRDLWGLMPGAWQAAQAGEVSSGSPANPFIAALNGDATDVRNAWAPAYLRQTAWNDPWITYGFGLPDDAKAPIHPIGAYSEPGYLGQLDSRSNTVDEVDSSDGEVVLVQTDGVASAHDNAGHSDVAFTSKRLCVSGDCVCPPGTAHAGERVADDDMALPFDLAFNAGYGGASYRVVGRSLQDECGQPNDDNPFPGGGSGTGGGGASGSGDTTCGPGCANSNGDPHLRTVNNVYYDFMAAGEFTLLRSRDSSIIVEARQEPYQDSDRVTTNTAIAALDNGHRVGIYFTDAGLAAHIDGTTVDPSAQAVDLGNGASLSNHPRGYELDFPDGTQLWALTVGSYGINLQVRPSDLLRRTAVGLLGPVVPGGMAVPELADGSRLPRAADDHAKFVATYQTLADSWRVTDSTSLFDYDPGKTTASYTNRAFPTEQAVDAQYDTTTASVTCADIADLGLRQQCIYDVAVTGTNGFSSIYATVAQLYGSGIATLDQPIGTITGPGSSPTPAPSFPTGPQTPPPTLAPTPANTVATGVDALKGAAIGPDGTVYLSVAYTGNTFKLLAVDPRSGSILNQVDAQGAGAVAVASGSVWVGELQGGSNCSITRLDSATLAVQAKIDTPCDFFATTLAASGDVVSFLDRQLQGSTQEGIRHIDPSTNVPSDPVVLPYFNGYLYGTSSGVTYGFSGQQPWYWLANGSTSLVSLGAHDNVTYPAGSGLWTMNDSGSQFVVDYFDSDAATPKQSVPIDGYLEGADDQALYISQQSTIDGTSQLWEYPVSGADPVQIGTSPPDFGNFQFDYTSNDPLLVGSDGVVQIWHVLASDTTTSSLVVQWMAKQ